MVCPHVRDALTQAAYMREPGPIHFDVTWLGRPAPTFPIELCLDCATEHAAALASEGDALDTLFEHLTPVCRSCHDEWTREGTVSPLAQTFARALSRRRATPTDESNADVHFELALAYRELALWREAITELEEASKSADRECACLTLIGLCYTELGDLLEAVVHFKKALYAEKKTDREELTLFFQLGAANEALGDRDEALYYFEKVAARDPRFRDVTERIAWLKRSRFGSKGGGDGSSGAPAHVSASVPRKDEEPDS